MSRIFAGAEEFRDTERASLGVHPIHVEDFRDQDKDVLWAEPPGHDPPRDVKVARPIPIT